MIRALLLKYLHVLWCNLAAPLTTDLKFQRADHLGAEFPDAALQPSK